MVSTIQRDAEPEEHRLPVGAGGCEERKQGEASAR